MFWGLVAGGVSVLWALITISLTDLHGMLFPYQMLKKFPAHSKGLPAIAHGGLTIGPLIWSGVVGWIVGAHSGEWTRPLVLMLFGFGMALSGAMHLMYSKTPFPDPLAWKEEGMVPAGWSHLPYAGCIFTTIGLFYFCSTPTSAEAVAVAVAVVVGVAVGNHIVLGWLNTKYHWSWCPEFIRKPEPWATIAATCLVLAGLTWFATDVQAGMYVLMACVFIAWIIYMRVTKTFSNGTRMGL